MRWRWGRGKRGVRSWGAKLGSPQWGQAKSWGPPALAGGTSGVGAAFNQLSLPSPAPPGPCTRPRTSWRTSATCSMTWPTSWTRCWTEPCSLLPFPASGCSASARGDGGRADPAPLGASGSLQLPPSLHFAPQPGTWPPLLTRPVSPAPEPPGSMSHAPAQPRGSGVSHRTGSRRRALRGCACGPGGRREALAQR